MLNLGSNRFVLAGAVAVLAMAGLAVCWNGCAGDIVVKDDVGNGDAAEDGGIQPGDGGEDASDGDGGPADASPADGGDVGPGDGGKDGGPDGGADGGWLHPAVIKFGTGIDIWISSDAGAQSLVVMKDTLASVEKVLGKGTPTADNKWLRSFSNWALDAFFVDASDGKNPEDSTNLLQGFILHKAFNGKTQTGHGTGDTRNAWESELGTPEYSNDYQGTITDIYFTKGGSVIYDPSGLADTVTVYSKQKVVPNDVIDWENLSVFTIKCSLLSGASPFSDVTTALGPPDQITTYAKTVTVEAYAYFSLGMSFWGQQKPKPTDEKVSTIILTAPYFGKLIGSTDLRMGSTYADVSAFFATKTTQCVDSLGAAATCVEKQAEYTNPDTSEKFTIYYYWIKRENPIVIPLTAYYMSVGFIYSKDKDGNPDRLASILLGYPAEDK